MGIVTVASEMYVPPTLLFPTLLLRQIERINFAGILQLFEI